jgi:hypothetical protein
VRYAPACCNNDLSQDSDFKYRTLIVFLPGTAGVLYFPGERRGAEVGVVGSLIPLDVSWLRLNEDVTAEQGRQYPFGDHDSYVNCFFGNEQQEEVVPTVTA